MGVRIKSFVITYFLGVVWLEGPVKGLDFVGALAFREVSGPLLPRGRLEVAIFLGPDWRYSAIVNDSISVLLKFKLSKFLLAVVRVANVFEFVLEQIQGGLRGHGLL